MNEFKRKIYWRDQEYDVITVWQEKSVIKRPTDSNTSATSGQASRWVQTSTMSKGWVLQVGEEYYEWPDK